MGQAMTDPFPEESQESGSGLFAWYKKESVRGLENLVGRMHAWIV